MSKTPANGLKYPVGPQAHEKSSRSLPSKLRRFLPRSVQGIMFFLLFVALIPTVIAEIIHLNDELKDRRAQEYQANLELSRSVASTFETYAGDVLHQELAIGLAIVSFFKEGLSEQVYRLLTVSAGDYPAIDNYSWVNPQGRIIASSSPEAGIMDVSDRPYFQEIV